MDAISPFQSTRPRGARQNYWGATAGIAGFNPRARAGRDVVHPTSSVFGHVSIHAPARGATDSGQLGRGRQRVSIHAPARGATRAVTTSSAWLMFQSTRPRGARPKVHPASVIVIKFQSTRPRGARHSGGDRCGGAPAVSIHAPARGATEHVVHAAHQGFRFNPRARAGRDSAVTASAPPDQFQSTRPRGARHQASQYDRAGSRFNPRARAGRDASPARIWARHSSFNPRARAGRDFRQPTLPRSTPVSIHAPARGATFNYRRRRWH